MRVDPFAVVRQELVFLTPNTKSKGTGNRGAEIAIVYLFQRIVHLDFFTLGAWGRGFKTALFPGFSNDAFFRRLGKHTG
jgi:hypothetical protein